MDTYRFIVEVEVEIDAPSEDDALEIVDDIYGKGNLQDFDVRVTNMSVLSS